ncbi:MAG: bifunctional UDP-sugar hydrolase/5'-nucleotidase, partial [Candidatus Riflebacteria bacterium]
MKNRFAALLTLAFSLFAAILSAAPVNFTILHTSDIHAHLQPVASGSEMVGGYARIKAYKDSLEEEGRNVLMLSSGDIFQGTFFYKFFQGIPDIEFMNRTGYAAMTLGNHEFDGGQAALAEALTYARFPILAANIQFKKIPELQSKLKPWVMIKAGPAEDPVKVAIIGITAENLPEIVPSVFVKDIDVLGAEETLKRYLPEIQMAGAEVILLLSHLGWEKELQLFENFPELDGILGGHSHLAISPPAVVEGPQGHRFLSEPGEWGKGVTRYDLIFDRDAERALQVTAAALVPMNEGIPEDGQIKQQADGLWQQIQVKVNIPIGKTSVYLNGDREHIRTRETNLGNLVADCVADTVAADMAVMNGGGIRSSIATGTVTIGDCLNVLPFDNYLIKVEMTGATLTKIFEQVREAIGHESGFGGFLQVSRGLQVKYYSNLVVVTFNGQPVEPLKKYTVATNDFLSGGGNGLTAFLESDTTESTGVLA